jgi:hypothetical protein
MHAFKIIRMGMRNGFALDLVQWVCHTHVCWVQKEEKGQRQPVYCIGQRKKMISGLKFCFISATSCWNTMDIRLHELVPLSLGRNGLLIMR